MLKEYPINTWPEHDRPRERLFNLGVEVLSDIELVAILLGNGNKEKSAVTLAQLLLSSNNGILGLGKKNLASLTKVSGIGLAKAARILAACELGRRREKTSQSESSVIKSATDVIDLVAPIFKDAKQEKFLNILLDNKNKVMAKKIIGLGSINEVAIYPREVFAPVFEYAAAKIILAHNHTSGDVAPSSEDINLTKQLLKISKLLGVELLDHIIWGEKKFTSLANQGYIK